jgi:hypothetical protein
MRNDSSVQYVTVTKSYRPSINSDTSNVSVIGANINIWSNDSVYTLRDTSVLKANGKDTAHFYYIKNLKPVAGQVMEIEALMPNGLLLQSSSTVPDVSELNFFDISSDILVPPVDGRNYIYVLWQAVGDVYYQPRIMINYYLKGSSVLLQHQVPLMYTTQNGSSVPVYPSHTKNNYFKIDVATITTALNEIAASKDDKANYNISNIDVQLIVYDDNLTTYYSSLQNSVDDFTVQVDAADYSNIQGGYGIFGSFSRTDFYIKLSSAFLSNLGY